MGRSVFQSSASVASHSCAASLFSTFFLICLFFSAPASAQNYLTNSNFEDLNNCTEYHQDCSSEAWFNIRPAVTPLINFRTVPPPAAGKDLLIVQVENIQKPVVKRSFVYTMFCCPLQKGKKYKLSFYINSGGKSFYGIDFYMRKKEFTSDNFQADSVEADIHIPADAVTNLFGEWNYIEVYYTARGDEKFLLVGNLSKQRFEFSSYQRMNDAGDVFYFIDDIAFRPLNAEPLCAQFEKNRRKLYEQNLRHTEHALVDAEPEIITDTVTVPAVFFETDKAVLKPAFRKLIDSLVLKLTDKNIIKIKIEGHTDNAGATAHNLILSQQRSESVRSYFTRKLPAETNKISAEGKGEAFPVTPNTNAAGMAKNRRVEIILTYSSRKE